MTFIRHRATNYLLSLLLAAFSLAGCNNANNKPNPSGTLEAIEIDLAPTLAGKLLQVRPQLGDQVKVGDTLLVLDTDLLFLQRSQTVANKGSIAAQRQVVRDGLEQAQRNLEFLELQLKRSKALVEQGSSPQQQLDDAQTRRDVAVTQVASMKHQILSLDAEEAKLDAAISVFDRQLRDGVVLAPSNGTVLLRAVEPGEVVTPGKVCLRTADISRLDLKVYLGETELAKVKIGQSLPVMIDALKGETLSGEITWISAESEFTPKNAQTRDARAQLVYAIKLSIANPDGRLHIGMPAEVKL